MCGSVPSSHFLCIPGPQFHQRRKWGRKPGLQSLTHQNFYSTLESEKKRITSLFSIHVYIGAKKKKKTQSDSLKVKLEVKPTCTYTNQLITEVYTISSKWLVQVQLPNTPKRQHDYSPKRDIYMHASVGLDLYVCACVCNVGCLHAGDCRKVSYLVVHGDLHRGGFALFQVLFMKT